MNDLSIPSAICLDGGYLYASELTRQDREQYKQLHIRCPECGTKLIVAINNERYIFKHYANQSCLFESKKFNKEYREYILYQNHESEKHKLLKNKLKEKLELSDDPLIDKTSVCIEKYTDGRRADVYCERNSKKIAFEVQISPLSLSIILGRINHYRDNKIHLFWIVESTKFQKQQFQRDIKYYGLSEHIYELYLDNKLLKCHFESPKIYFDNGSFSIKKILRQETINLSDLQIIEDQPMLLNYENEEKQLRKIISVIYKAAKSLDKSSLQAIDDKLDQLKDKKPLSRENFDTIKKSFSWLKQYPNLLSKTVFQAARIVNFFDYIEKFHKKDNYINKDWGEPDDELTEPFISFPCPTCQSMNRGYRGRFCLDKNQKQLGSCDYCDYKNIDLIQYIADMRHNGNKFKAAEEICHNLTIPYKSGI